MLAAAVQYVGRAAAVGFEVCMLDSARPYAAHRPLLSAERCRPALLWATTAVQVNITFPASLFDTLTKQQIGRAMYTLINVSSSCYDSSYQPVEESSGGGFPTWAIAVIASVVGCALLALVAVAFLWRRKRRLEAQLEAAKSGSLPDEESGGRMSKHNSGVDLVLPGGSALGSYDHTISSRASGKLSGKPSGDLASPMHSQWLRAR